MREAIAGLQENLQTGPVEVVCAPEFGRELQTELRRVRQLKPRLLVVLGTPALMRVAPLEKNTPVVFALVANPYFTGAPTTRSIRRTTRRTSPAWPRRHP